MADFQTQAMGITGLTIDASSTAPSRVEFSQFLNDGVLDVTDKWLIGHPQDREDFTRESAETTSNASLTLNSANIIAVVREDGVTSNNWRPCRKITPAQQYLVLDTESLSFASEVNPVYMIGDAGKISVFPVPGSDPNSFKVYYVNNSPEETDGTALDHASTGIKYFPSDRVYLVVLYASIRSIQAKMSATTITDLSVNAVPPDVPTITDVSFADATAGTVAAVTLAYTNTAVGGTPPAYAIKTLTAQTSFNSFFESGSLNPLDDSDPGSLSVSAVPPDAPSLSAISYTSIDSPVDSTLTAVTASSTLTGAAASANVPTYTPPTVGGATEELTTTMGTGSSKIDFSDWFDQVGDYIETSEDTELASAQIQKISTYIQAYGQAMQNNLNDFNEANVKFQASVQESMTEFQGLNQKNIADAERSQNRQLQTAITDMKVIFDNNAQSIQKYDSDLQSYQADVNAQVQEQGQNMQRYQTELNTVYQAWAKTESDNIQKFQLDTQNELNDFNEENAIYQANLQHTLARVQAENNVNIQEAQIELQDKMKDADLATQVSMQAAISDMQAIVAKNESRTAKYIAELQSYQAEVAAEVQEYTQNLQGDGMGYQWLQDQYTRLKAEYDQVFMVATPNQPAQARGRR